MSRMWSEDSSSRHKWTLSIRDPRRGIGLRPLPHEEVGFVDPFAVRAQKYEPVAQLRRPLRMPEKSPLVVAIVLVYNKWPLLQRSLPALFQSDVRNLHVIVIDNGSATPAPPELDPWLRRSEVIRNERNLGYAGGNNVGLRRALELGAEHVLLLNDDAFLEKTCLCRLLDVLHENPDVGAVGPLVFNAQSPEVLQSAGGMWSEEQMIAYHRDGGSPPRGGYPPLLPADYVDGCCLLLRSSALRHAGFLDEGFFIFFEEVELCFRIRGAGFKCVVVRDARVDHQGAATMVARSPSRTYLFARNRVLYARKTSRGIRRFRRIFRSIRAEMMREAAPLVGMEDPTSRLSSLPASDPKQSANPIARGPILHAWIRGNIDGLLGLEGAPPAWTFDVPAASPRSSGNTRT